MLNYFTLKKNLVLPSVFHPILLVAKKLYGAVLMLLFTAVAVVALLVSAIVAAVFSPKKEAHSSSPLK